MIEIYPAPPGTVLDRANHRRSDPEWLAQAWRRARILIVDPTSPTSGHALLSADGRLVFVGSDDPSAAATEPSGRFFLGLDEDETPYFAALGVHPDVPGARRVTVRDIRGELDARDSGILMTAVALANWHRRHAFSPETGKPIEATDGGWSRIDGDGRQYWPRTDPAVIVLIHDGVAGPEGRCLLGHNVLWRPEEGRPRRFSCLAGFVEAGESAEAAVEREVFEESGVRVADVRYAASQPWPYPGSLMLGFYAIADPAAPLQPDNDEIADVRWFTRAEIRAALDPTPGVPPAEPGLPMPASIAHRLIRGWAASS